MTAIKSKNIIILSLACILFITAACSQKKAILYSKRPIPPFTAIAVIVDTPNKIKNVVLSRFLTSGYNVKAFAASDLYALSDVYDVRDLKKIANKTTGDLALVSMEKTYNNIFKLHVYNYEINKAEMLDEIKAKWNVQYLVLLDLQDWQKVCWARAIDLNTYEIIWLENYPTKYVDNIETVIDHFIQTMTKGK